MEKSNQNYYDEKLSAQRLQRCYEIAPPRIKQYLQAEIDHVCSFIQPGHRVLELGCGYGRVLDYLIKNTANVFGMDLSMASLVMAKREMQNSHRIKLAQMNATDLGFKDNAFDLVCCIQNGISAFKVDNLKLLSEAVRVTRSRGIVLFSTYVRDFWKSRLEWFEIQAKEGLLGEIDYNKTGDGEIVCKDGFKATTYSPQELANIAQRLNHTPDIYEIDSSSLFLKIIVP